MKKRKEKEKGILVKNVNDTQTIEAGKLETEFMTAGWVGKMWEREREGLLVRSVSELDLIGFLSNCSSSLLGSNGGLLSNKLQDSNRKKLFVVW